MVSVYEVRSSSRTPVEASVMRTACPPGQIRLKQSSVIVVGAGGLGCPALQYLAAAGVGEPTRSYFFSSLIR